MHAWSWMLKEIGYRKTGFLLGLFSISMAMTAWTGAVMLLRAHDRQTELLLEQRRIATQSEMRRMEDDYRRIMRDLGYNTMIVSGEEDLAALRVRGFPLASLPYATVERLAASRIETLNHLLPVLQRRVTWPETGMEIILSGTPGQIPITHLARFLTPDGRAYRNPIMETIPPGELILGHDVARALSLRAGDRTVLMGDSFRIRKVHPAEGSSDDIAVWCHLDWVQRQLGMEGKINLILALECVCDADSLGRITAEVTRVLPDVQVLEFSSRTRARALARRRAEEAHRTAMNLERRHRAGLRDGHRRLAAVLAPLIVTGSMVWMFFLFLGNVRERTLEIGILRAVGIREETLLALFLLKSLAMGLVGAIAGFAAGHALGIAWAGIRVLSRESMELLNADLLLAALLTAPALCVLAAWLPAVWAIRKDPARILCEA